MPEREAELRILGRVLRRLRDARGITQTELGERIGMDYSYISRIERGRIGLGWLTLRRLLRALDTSLDRLGDAIEQEERSDAS